MIVYKEFQAEEGAQVLEIYAAQGWKSYLERQESLPDILERSLYLLGAYHGEKLVGFVRCVGDGEHTVLVEDLIVAPQYQRQGIGSHLFQSVWDKYAKVHLFLVLTDIEDQVDNHFYQSFSMKKLQERHMVGYVR